MWRVKRVYAQAGKEDGWRVLVDRLWPRGIKKEAAKVDVWMKEIAPSNALRKWFGHEPVKWPEFQKEVSRGIGDQEGAGRRIEENGKGTRNAHTALRRKR